MASLSRPQYTVTISYLSRGKRVERVYADAYEARKAFVRLDRQGREPVIASIRG